MQSFLMINVIAAIVNFALAMASIAFMIYCFNHRHLSYIYKILDKNTGLMIEVSKEVFDTMYKALEPVAKEAEKRAKELGEYHTNEQ